MSPPSGGFRAAPASGAAGGSGLVVGVDPGTAGAGQDYLRHLGYGAPDWHAVADSADPVELAELSNPQCDDGGHRPVALDCSAVGRHGGTPDRGMDVVGRAGYRRLGCDAWWDTGHRLSGIATPNNQGIGGIANPATYTGPDYSQYYGAIGRSGGYPGLPAPGTYSGPGVGAAPSPGTYARESLGSSRGGAGRGHIW